MVRFVPLLRRAWRLVTSVAAPLAVVPVITALVQYRSALRVLERSGPSISVRLSGPQPVVDLWNLIQIPTAELFSVAPTVAELVGRPTFVAWLIVGTVVNGLLAAGLLGSVDEAFATGRYRFADAIGRYWVPLVGYQLLVLAGIGVVVVAGSVASLGFVVGLVVLIGVYYLFYGAPFLVVVRDIDLVTALRESYALAVAGGDYLSYLLQYAVATAMVSLPLSVITLNSGPAGLALGLVLAGPVGLTLAATTVAFFRSLEGADPAEVPESGRGRTDANASTAGDRGTRQ